MKIFLTGATGLLGGELASRLSESAKIIYLLVRPKSKIPEHFHKPPFKLIRGDLSHPRLIFNEEDRQELIKSVDTMIHAGAYYNLFGDRSENYLANIVGTQNLLFLAREMKKLKSFHFISSVAVAGKYRGVFSEDKLDMNQKFDNPYSETKFESEYHVRKSTLPVLKRIYRPGVIIGDSRTGALSKKDGPYYFFDFLKKLSQKKALLQKLPYFPLPYDPKALLPLIPIDQLSDGIVSEILKPQKPDSPLRCYHLLSPDSPTIEQFLTDSQKAFNLSFLKFWPLPRQMKKMIKGADVLTKFGMPSDLVDYMYAQARFDQEQALDDIKILKASSYQLYKKAFLKVPVSETKGRAE